MYQKISPMLFTPLLHIAGVFSTAVKEDASSAGIRGGEERGKREDRKEDRGQRLENVKTGSKRRGKSRQKHTCQWITSGKSTSQMGVYIYPTFVMKACVRYIT